MINLSYVALIPDPDAATGAAQNSGERQKKISNRGSTKA